MTKQDIRNAIATADRIMAERIAQLALEEAIFDGPADTAEPAYVTIGAALLGLVGIAAWTSTLYLIIHA